MEENVANSNEAAVSNLLLISNQGHCNNSICSCDDSVDDGRLLGWQTFVRNQAWRGQKTSPAKSRTKNPNGRPQTLQSNVDGYPNCVKATTTKYTGKRSEPLPSTTELLAANLHRLETHEDHASFYTAHYSTTKECEIAQMLTDPYGLESGDSKNLEIRLKILELLSDYYKLNTAKRNESQSLPVSSLQTKTRLSVNANNPRIFSGAKRKDIKFEGTTNNRLSSRGEFKALDMPRSQLDVTTSLSRSDLSRDPPKPLTPSRRVKSLPQRPYSGKVEGIPIDLVDSKTYRLNSYQIPYLSTRKRDGMTLGNLSVEHALINGRSRTSYTSPFRSKQAGSASFQKVLNKVVLSYSDTELRR